MSKEVNLKTPKKKGPIRFEAIIPLTIVLALIAAFNFFFLDSILKKSFETVASRINGAQVDIGNFSTSFARLELLVEKVEVTNKSHPERNLFEIGEIRFKALWDALLRAKFVVDLAQVADIEVDTERKRPGKVYPPSDSKLSQLILNKAEEEFKGNILGDVVALLSGSNLGEVGENIRKDMDSIEVLEQARQDVEDQRQKLEKLYEDLPSGKELEGLKARFNKIKWGDLGNIRRAAQTLKEARELKKDAEAAIDKYESLSKEVNKSVATVELAKAQVDSAIAKDVTKLKSRFSIPSLDASSIAQGLFGGELAQKLLTVNELKDKAQRYMPPKREKEDEETPVYVNPPRESGVDYQFPITTSYPLVWIKKVAVNSSTDQGSVAGEILNISSDQVAAKAPMSLELTGDFPASQIRDAKIVGTLDHRESIPKGELEFSVGQYPLKGLSLADSEQLKFGIKKAVAKSSLKASYVGEELSLSFSNLLEKPEFESVASGEAAQTFLAGIAQRANRITLNASASGTEDNLKWKVESNLANAVSQSAGSLLQAKIDQANAQLERKVEQEVGARRQELNREVQKIESGAKKELAEAKKQLDSFKKEIDAKLDNLPKLPGLKL